MASGSLFLSLFEVPFVEFDLAALGFAADRREISRSKSIRVWAKGWRSAE